MTVLDWGLLLVVGVSALLGAWRGLIALVVSLAAWLLAGLAAYLFGGDIAGRLAGEGPPEWDEHLGGYALAFAAVWVAVTLLGLLVRRIAHSAGLSGPDRLFGFGLGLARGLLLASVLVLMLGMTRIPRGPAWRHSATLPMLLPVAGWLRDSMPRVMAQGVDLEGRGNSLQEAVQSEPVLMEALRPGRPRPNSRLPWPTDPVPSPPAAVTQDTPTTVAPGRQPDDQVH